MSVKRYTEEFKVQAVWQVTDGRSTRCPVVRCA